MPKKHSGPESHPQAVLQQIELLARNITVARKRRGETQAQWAKRLGVSQPTMARIERGDPAVAMASYVMCMWLVNPAVDLAGLIAPVNDHASLEREVFKVEQRRRSQAPMQPRKAPPAGPQAVKSGEPGQTWEKARKAAVGDLGQPTLIAKGLASLLSKGGE
jgi:DNA-binding XRE family transcriptional regulator